MRMDDYIASNIDRNLRNKLGDKESIENIHKKILETLEKERPEPMDFVDHVDMKDIEKDIADVILCEKNWAKEISLEDREIKQQADIAEYIIYKNLGSWIEHKANPLLTTKADDYLRGVDLLIESEDDEKKVNHLGLGVDVALIKKEGYSSGFEKKKKKMERYIKTGKLTEARYVSGAHFEGSLNNLPYIILSIGSNHVNDLVLLSTHKISSEKEKSHILKYIVAYQIVRQLGCYYQVSEAQGFELAAHQYGVANNFASDLFTELISELQNNPELWLKVSNDVGVVAIEKFCDDLEKELL